MGESPGTPPPVPDPIATAKAQTQSNVDTGIAGSVIGNANEISPYGNVNYSVTGHTLVDGQEIPTYTRTTSLSAPEQKLFDQQTQLGQQENQVAGTALKNVGSILGQPIDMSSLPSLASSFAPSGQIQTSVGPTDFTADRDATTNAILSRLQPQQDRDKELLSSTLANQGVAQGSAAWNAAMASNSNAVNDARLAAVQAGDTEQQQLFGEALNQGQFANAAQAQQFGENQSQAEFGNTARQQALQELLSTREAPLNEITALMSGGQVTAPQFSAYRGGTIDPTNVSGDIYSSAGLANQQYQTQAQMAGQENAGLFSLGSSLLGAGGSIFGAGLKASDRRLKRDIVRVGALHGLPIHQFRYLWDDDLQIGVMADEVLAVAPEAVSVGPGGYLMVDYARLP